MNVVQMCVALTLPIALVSVDTRQRDWFFHPTPGKTSKIGGLHVRRKLFEVPYHRQLLYHITGNYSIKESVACFDLSISMERGGDG
jgi:hypothetical protein